jgi:hypothetical protein
MVEAINQQKVLIFTGGKATAKREDLDLLGGSPGGVATVGALRESLQEILPVLGALMTDIKEAAIKQRLEEVSVSLGINGKGKIGFLGTGSEVGGEASLTLKFKI